MCEGVEKQQHESQCFVLSHVVGIMLSTRTCTYMSIGNTHTLLIADILSHFLSFFSLSLSLTWSALCYLQEHVHTCLLETHTHCL